MNLVPAALACAGILAVWIALLVDTRARPWASAIGWLGIFAGVAGLRADVLGLTPMQGAAPGLGMAASASLVATLVPFDERRFGRIAAGCGSIAALLWIGASYPLADVGLPPLWRGGIMLTSVHWAAWAASLAAALAGAGLAIEALAVRRGLELAPDDPGIAEAHRFAARALALAWLTWPLAHLIHWRTWATLGVGSPNEWLHLGVCLLATGLLVAGGERAETRAGRLGSALVPLAVCLLLMAGAGLASSFGTPLGTNLPWP